VNRTSSIGLALLVAAACCTSANAATQRAPSPSTALEIYRSDAAALLADELVPRLERGRGSRSDVPRFTVTVVPSRDPLRLDLETRPDGTVALAISAGFVLFSDALVDAEVLGRLANQRPEVQRYFDDIVAFAGIATRTGAERNSPGPFYARLGWKKTLYDVTYASAEYQQTRSEVFIQAITWIVAHAVVAATRGEGHETDRIAAEWLAQSGFAPLPNVGMTMLYFAARDPAETRPLAWRCRARVTLETGVEAVEALRARGAALPTEIPENLLARGKELAIETAPADTCTHPRHDVPSPRRSEPK
jgi:hypothetical protein